MRRISSSLSIRKIKLAATHLRPESEMDGPHLRDLDRSDAPGWTPGQVASDWLRSGRVMSPLRSPPPRRPLASPRSSRLRWPARKRCAKQPSCWALPVLGPNAPENAKLMARTASLRDIRPRSSPRGRGRASDGQKGSEGGSDGDKGVTRAECVRGFVGVAVVMSLMHLERRRAAGKIACACLKLSIG